MKRLIITPDDHVYREDTSTLLVYDFDKKELIKTVPKQPELISKTDDGLGRTPFRPFGITHDEKNVYVVSNSVMGVFDKLNISFKKVLDVPLFVNTHQILKSGNVLYTTNTSTDTIGIYDLTTKQNKFFNISNFFISLNVEKPWHVYSHEIYHVNSIFEYEENVYFCLHNRGKRKSKFGFFNKETLKGNYLFEAGSHAHGIVVVDNMLYSLSSGTGEIIKYDLKKKSLCLIPFVDSNVTFLRGLDIQENKLLIGCSNNHKSEKILYKNNCYISLMDLNTQQIERYMEIPEAYVITDLRLI